LQPIGNSRARVLSAVQRLPKHLRDLVIARDLEERKAQNRRFINIEELRRRAIHPQDMPILVRKDNAVRETVHNRL
jgi:hypothetical protein